MIKRCVFCTERNASSKEHLIANSRLKRIQSFKAEEQKNDNVRKKYKKITCEGCNRSLGKYEAESPVNLAYSTAWKILAGNINGAFTDQDYILRSTEEDGVKSYEEQLRNIIEGEYILPANTFTFDIEIDNSFAINFGVATFNYRARIEDENGPVEDALFCLKDNAGSEKEGEYSATSDEDGNCNLEILVAIELVRVFTSELTLRNVETGEVLVKNIDFIFYISLDSLHRLILILPIIGATQTPWENSEVQFIHRDFLEIIWENFE